MTILLDTTPSGFQGTHRMSQNSSLTRRGTAARIRSRSLQASRAFRGMSSSSTAMAAAAPTSIGRCEIPPRAMTPAGAFSSRGAPRPAIAFSPTPPQAATAPPTPLPNSSSDPFVSRRPPTRTSSLVPSPIRASISPACSRPFAASAAFSSSGPSSLRWPLVGAPAATAVSTSFLLPLGSTSPSSGLSSTELLSMVTTKGLSLLPPRGMVIPQST
mmetsp:Transcript_37344/g.111869  ORF Transcript_37344/g.111869 Transcript_37344/m.111869 type:complete len:215 (+) Transcript_37344:2063-2707(+)